MNTATTTDAAPRGGLGAPRATQPAPITRVPFLRLVAVESRKLMDTRSGQGLAIAVLALTVVAVEVAVLAADVTAQPLSYRSLLDAVAVATGLLLPVLGILSVTTEWSQRTHMVTFTLEPHRARVVAAKLVTAAVVAVLAAGLALGLGALAYLGYGQLTTVPLDWDLSVTQGLGLVAVQVLSLLTGVAFGMLLLNTAAAVVAYAGFAYVLPTIFLVLGSFVSGAGEVIAWIDFAGAQRSLGDGFVTAEGWAQLAASGAIWFLLPLSVGLVRILRADIK